PGGPLREVLGATLRRHLLARIGRQDLGDRVWILRILHRLDGEAELDRLVIALAHEERALEALVARVFPGLDNLLDGVGARLLDRFDTDISTLLYLSSVDSV